MCLLSRFVDAFGRPIASNAAWAEDHEPAPDEACLRQPLTLARFRHKDADVALGGGDEACVILHLSGHARVERIRNGARSERPINPSLVTVVDPDDVSEFKVRGRAEFLALHLPMSEVSNALDVPGEQVAIRTRFNEVERVVERNAYRALAELSRGGCSDTLLLSSMAFALALAIAERRQGEHRRAMARATGGLSRRQVRKTADLIVSMVDAPVAASPTLSRLAKEADLSIYHFAREFRRTFGCSPYAYTLRLRLDRARDLVVRSDEAISDIARQTGFCSAAHLSDRFRSETGMTPASLRTSVRG